MPLLPILTAQEARTIIQAKGQAEVKISLDLGLTSTTIPLTPQGLLYQDTLIPWKQLEKILKSDRKCLQITPDGLKQIKTHSQTTSWVRTLAATSGAPTTLVSGYPMHRIKNTDPWQDTKAKLAACLPISGHVLDTATGLGYTTIQALQNGATSVTTIELDPAAITIAEQNPWSQPLFNNPKITQIIGDATDVIQTLPQSHFSLIIHDPPTIQFAGELYSTAFYINAKRILTPKGHFFHYIGDPNSKLGHTLTEGTYKRLQEAGFKKIIRKPEAFGLIALP